MEETKLQRRETEEEHRRHLKDTVGHGNSKQRHDTKTWTSNTGEYQTKKHNLNITQRHDSRVVTDAIL